MPGKNEYSWQELAAAVDRIERKLDLYLYRTDELEHGVYDFNCPRLLECELAGKYCWLCGRKT